MMAEGCVWKESTGGENVGNNNTSPRLCARKLGIQKGTVSENGRRWGERVRGGGWGKRLGWERRRACILLAPGDLCGLGFVLLAERSSLLCSIVHFGAGSGSAEAIHHYCAKLCRILEPWVRFVILCWGIGLVF